MTTSPSNNDDTDEITQVLHHFQPIPEFVATATRSRPAAATSPRRKKRFSGVQYLRKRSDEKQQVLRLSFHLDRAIGFQCEVTTTEKPYRVVCTDFGGKDIPLDIVRQVKDICSQLTLQSAEDKTSLFSLLSKLLGSLNNVKCTLSDAAQTAALQGKVQQATETTRRIWDLELLLLRCATVGRDRSTFCTPIPEEYQRKYGLRAAEAIYNVSEGISTFRLQPQQQQCRMSQLEQELMGYLIALRPHHSQGQGGTTSLSKCQTTRRGSDFMRIQMTLDIVEPEEQATPRFTKLATQRGTTQVYHGTKMECVWSILNCGLWTLSETKFCKHGSLFGTGVYFSTSYKVAYRFSGNNNPASTNTTHARSLHQVWRHPSSLRLLQLSNNPQILKDYDIHCFPVFEAQIISPPSSTSMDDKSATTATNNCTRRDGTYYVVPNSRDIRVTKLHLTFELVRKRTFSMLWFGVILFAMLVIRQASLMAQQRS